MWGLFQVFWKIITAFSRYYLISLVEPFNNQKSLRLFKSFSVRAYFLI
jgi:hypothetical protein